MTSKHLISILDGTNLRDQQADLLVIAELDLERLSERRMRRADIGRVLVCARAVALLVRILLQRQWDRMYYVVGSRVLLRFGSTDLLGHLRAPVHTVINQLAHFPRWVDARAALIARGVDANAISEDERARDPKVTSALTYLAWIQNQYDRNGRSLNEVFIEWATQIARVHPIKVTVGVVDGSTLRLSLPPRTQLFAPTQAWPSLPHAAPTTINKILSLKEYRWVKTSTGAHLLVPRDAKSEEIREGTRIGYSTDALRPLRSWFLLH